MKTLSKLWIGIAFLAVITPLGLYVPYKLNSKSAWGEWSAQEIKMLVGYIPGELEKVSGVWKAPVSGYGAHGWFGKDAAHRGFGYFLSGIIGIAACVGIAFIIGKILSKKEKKR